MLIAHAKVIQGHRVASGLSQESPYPKGTIAMQTPHFLKLGLDLRAYYAGTLNLHFNQHRCVINHADYLFEQVNWAPGFAPETFSFVQCQLHYRDNVYSSLIYYPHPETKIQHFQQESVLEILAPPIAQLNYSDSIALQYDPHKVTIAPVN